jgi:hypothetical protein
MHRFFMLHPFQQCHKEVRKIKIDFIYEILL